MHADARTGREFGHCFLECCQWRASAQRASMWLLPPSGAPVTPQGQSGGSSQQSCHPDCQGREGWHHWKTSTTCCVHLLSHCHLSAFHETVTNKCRGSMSDALSVAALPSMFCAAVCQRLMSSVLGHALTEGHVYIARLLRSSKATASCNAHIPVPCSHPYTKTVS